MGLVERVRAIEPRQKQRCDVFAMSVPGHRAGAVCRNNARISKFYTYEIVIVSRPLAHRSYPMPIVCLLVDTIVSEIVFAPTKRSAVAYPSSYVGP